MKFSIKDFFCKSDHLLEKSLMENFIFWAVHGIFSVLNELLQPDLMR